MSVAARAAAAAAAALSKDVITNGIFNTTGIDIAGISSQISGFAQVIGDLSGTIYEAQSIIIKDVSGMVTTAIDTAVTQATIAAQTEISNMPESVNSANLGTTNVNSTNGFEGGGRCMCKCKYNKITRRKRYRKKNGSKTKYKV